MQVLFADLRYEHFRNADGIVISWMNWINYRLDLVIDVGLSGRCSNPAMLARRLDPLDVQVHNDHEYKQVIQMFWEATGRWPSCLCREPLLN